MFYDRNRNNYRRNSRQNDGGGRQQQYQQQPQQRREVGGGGGGGNSSTNRTFNNSGQQGRSPPGSDMPLRMVVNAKYVGAIIGQGGANIRQITKDSKARCVVDVSRGIRDPTGTLEKVINIYGPPENCSKACAKILDVVHREAQNDPANQGKNVDPELKLRAHNNLVGRLIGKAGSTIKKIMEETGCTVFVSNSNDAMPSSESLPSTPVAYCLPPIVQPPFDDKSRFYIQQPPTPSCMINVPPSAFLQPPSSASTPNARMFIHYQRPSPLSPLPSPSNHNRHFLNPSISELNAFNMERTITIRGAVANICQAETKISAKLRQCWENDMANAPYSMYGQSLMSMPPPFAAIEQYPPGRHVQRVPPTSVVRQQQHHVPGAYSQQQPPGVPPSLHHQGTRSASSGGHLPSPGGGGGPSPSVGVSGPPLPRPPPFMPSDQSPRMGPTEVVHVWVPNNMVGALIGTKGVHIRNVMRLTGAHIRIEATKTEAAGNGAEVDATPNDRRIHSEAERRVTVTGTDFQQYKAQFWIFQRACEQGYNFFEDVRLCTDIQVPSRMVGRIIGKGGQNVRELQRFTGAQVKIPDDAVNAETEQTTVQIIGNFNAAQAVQSRVRHLVNQFLAQQYRAASGDHHQQQPAYHQYRNAVGPSANAAGAVVNHNDVDVIE